MEQGLSLEAHDPREGAWRGCSGRDHRIRHGRGWDGAVVPKPAAHHRSDGARKPVGHPLAPTNLGAVSREERGLK
jgi:hypothetical protein